MHVFQIQDYEDGVLGKGSEGCSSSLFDLGTLHEHVPQSIPLTTSSTKNDAYMVSLCL